MQDMAPELLQQVQLDWDLNLRNDAEVKNLIEKINGGKASYKEVEDLSYRIGKDLSKALGANITEEILPNGHVPQNVAEKILHPTLSNAHNMVTDVAAKVQEDMNAAAGINLKAQKTDYDKERAQGLVHKLTNGQFEDTKWILDEPVTLFVQSVADNTLKKNVEFQANSGLKPRIIRSASSKCCDWCENLEGTYDYGSEPKDVYRRHERCQCTVDYNPGNGKRQNVWSKEWHEDAQKEQIENRIENSKEYSSYNLTSVKTSSNLTVEEERALLKYKSFESYLLNEELRKSNGDISQLSAKDQVWVNNLDSALSKLPNYEGDLVRVIDFSKFKDRENRIDNFLKDYEIGNIVKYPSYISCSFKSDYNSNADIYIYVLNSKNGKDISSIGVDEGEVLYERDKSFISVNKIFNDGIWYIALEEK